MRTTHESIHCTRESSSPFKFIPFFQNECAAHNISVAPSKLYVKCNLNKSFVPYVASFAIELNWKCWIGTMSHRAVVCVRK